MAKNRKNQAAAIRFGPAVKALLLCLLIAGSAVGYVWQKSQLYQLSIQINAMEKQLTKLGRDNGALERQLADLRSPVKLDARARSLGLVPTQTSQKVRLTEEPPVLRDNQIALRQLAARPERAGRQ